MMFNKKSKDAIEDETSEKKEKGKAKKPKKPKLTPHQKALKNKQRVERSASASVRKAEAKVKKAEQAIKNKQKAAEKKVKDQEKKAQNRIRAEEKKIEKEEKKKEQKAENKIIKQDEKVKKKAEKMQRKAELAVRSPIQKKIDRRLKMKKFLVLLLVLIALVGLVFAGIKFGSKLIAKMNLPEISFSNIPFLNKEEPEEKTAKDDESDKAEETKETKKTAEETSTEAAIQDDKTLYISGTSVLEDFYSDALGEFLGLSKKEIKEHSSVASIDAAYTNLINGDQQIIFSSLPTDKETKKAELAGVDLHPIPIINGGFVFFVNKDNPVKSLTMTQLYNIYSGTITNWKDLGGKNEPIVAYQRAENSGSQLGMYKSVIHKDEIVKVSDEMKASTTKDIVQNVSSNKGAIGYSYYYYIENLKNSDFKMIAVNGVKPDKKTIASAKYPLTTYTYAIITTEENTKSLDDVISSVDARIDTMKVSESDTAEKAADDSKTTDAAVKAEPLTLKMKFIQWILSDEGQKLVEEKGFIRHDNK